MRETQPLFHRLFPAAIATSIFAALAHAVLVGIAARSIGLELVYIAAVTFVVALVGGAVLLAIVAALKLRPVSSLLLFLIVIQAIAIRLEMYLFEGSFSDISWQYGLISVPASVIAWHQSVYCAYRER
ncbi:hypothetical protein [Nitratireductor sp.]|uniref:hypothetical protein n=1 Tax=Nitratireductor sp. TaxID=1872084 RepID=UPI00262BF0D8|nr:hypothetical protein [Nitratireductor sp.]MCV0378080.1 hypothetical protein [Nitratireductor sp.]